MPTSFRTTSVDRAQRLLRTLGWSYGDMSHFDGIVTVWQVYAHRDEQRIVVRALSKAHAWDEALRQAGIRAAGPGSPGERDYARRRKS